MAEKSKIARRSFFTGVGLVAAAAATAKLTSSASPPSSATAPVVPQKKEEGYRLSEHIKKYYRTTTI